METTPSIRELLLFETKAIRSVKKRKKEKRKAYIHMCASY
jgi:hypothetical protein